MQKERCEAILLGGMDYREADRIVSLLTQEHGILRAVARGAKRSSHRFRGSLELFSRLSVILTVREGLCSLEESESITIFPEIRKHLPRIGLASYACELVDALLPEGMANRRVFRLLESLLTYLNEAEPHPSDRRFLELNLLNILGYRPSLENCAECGTEIGTAGGRWREGDASSICCGSCLQDGNRVSAGALNSMSAALRTSRFGQPLFPSSVLDEAGEVLDSAIRSHLHRSLKSLAFLEAFP